jgi:hypothetical protein
VVSTQEGLREVLPQTSAQVILLSEKLSQSEAEAAQDLPPRSWV